MTSVQSSNQPIETLVRARKLTVQDAGQVILEEIDFQIHDGEIVTIVGPNGSGKTTLLKALVGARRPQSGDLQHRNDLRVGYMPQNLAIDRSMPLTADGFMKLAGSYSRKDRRAALAQAEISDLAQSQLADLSGGELQRVLLARALLRQPNLLVLDEPTQGLDQPGEAAFYNLIERVRRETGTAVLMVSHDLHVVMSTSDRVICLNGHVCCEGAPDFVSESPEYRALFGHGTGGALALYRHDHDHHHHHGAHDHDNNSAGERT